ncbi:RNA ligase-domain-containing protein [Melampsora americana]|nr:RNA ligase-domain-containing protein [Melampsora americana]
MSRTKQLSLLARSIDSVDLKRTDVLVEQLLNFGKGISISENELNLQTADENALILAIEKLNMRSDEKETKDQQVKKLIRSHLYDHLHEFKIRSWSMLEHVYRKEPCPFPTRARGLFTLENSTLPIGQGRHQILARGYDKFFNVNEVSWTRWETLPLKSKGPYHLTMKTNGCIIFISALTRSQILVTSKHAMDTELVAQDTENKPSSKEKPVSHAGMGERWLERHLQSVRLTKTDLAAELWDANVTAVAELTDDTFEEHVLPTPSDEIGLNLHGLNLNHPLLYTYSPEHVAHFAKRWGFHSTPWKTVETVEDVKRECSSIEQTGWPGRDGFIEGVVVRGFLAEDDHSDPKKPYQPLFWKVKFEEPYLMYREWRELTRRMLSEFGKLKESQLSELQIKSANDHQRPSCDMEGMLRLLKINVKKIQNPESKLYVHWMVGELLYQDDRFEGWKLNQGIVNTRERFLKWRETADIESVLGSVNSRALQSKSKDSTAVAKKAFDKIMLVPIAIPGCGKTSLGVALSFIYRCDHTQSDDIKAKKTGPTFIANLKTLLLDSSGSKLLFADKNNHLKTHRKALSELVNQLRQGVRIKDPSVSKRKQSTTEKSNVEIKKVETRVIGLVWNVTSYARSELQHLASERIVKRGENHQSLRPELTSGGLHELSPDQFPLPTEAQLTNSISQIESYRTNVRKEMKLDPKLCEPRYFAIKVPIDLRTLVLRLFSESTHTRPKPDRRLLDGFISHQRFNAVPHITLLHSSELAAGMGTDSENRLKELWDFYRTQATSNHWSKENVEVMIGPRMIWDSRVMAIEVDEIKPKHLVSWKEIPIKTNCRLHITVGTMSDEIRPIEAGKLVEKVLKNLECDDQFEEGIHVLEIPIQTLKGSIRGLN